MWVTLAILVQGYFLSNDALITRVPRLISFFCSLIRRFVMCRKGWNTVATSAGWFEVIRGPHPPSVQWPKANVKLDKSNLKPQSRVRGRWQLPRQRKRWRLFAWIQMPSCRSGAQSGQVGAGHRSNGGLQGSRDGHSRLSAETSAERCTGAAVGRTDPSEGSIHRKGPEKRIVLYDEERAAEVSRLEESEKRLEELRAMRRTARSPAHTSCRCFLVGGPSQEEMNATFLFGEPFRSSRISGLIHQEFPTSCCFPIHGDQRGEVMRVPRRTVSRYGVRGTRVGEASNPGLRPEERSSP